MEFLTLMNWGSEDGEPFIPDTLSAQPEQAQPELFIVGEEPEV